MKLNLLIAACILSFVVVDARVYSSTGSPVPTATVPNQGGASQGGRHHLGKRGRLEERLTVYGQKKKTSTPWWPTTTYQPTYSPSHW
ncbi:hypothetical protein BC941DRAFT_410194, partial [Chlamydoabsidia padenii]